MDLPVSGKEAWPLNLPVLVNEARESAGLRERGVACESASLRRGGGRGVACESASLRRGEEGGERCGL